MIPCPETLADLFECDPDNVDLTKGSLFALNIALKLAPWMPPAVEVWCSERPDYMSRTDWNEVRQLLEELYAEHKRRNKGD